MLAALLLLGGCALSAPPARNGRYSVDITELYKSVRYKNTWIYRSPTRRIAGFQKFLVRPVVVYDDPVHKIKNRAPYDALADRLTRHTLDLMAKGHTVADAPGEGTLDIRIAVVDLKPVVEMKDAQGNNLTRADTTAKGSKIEVDCHDSVTNEQIFAMSTIYEGKEFAAAENKSRLPSIERAYDEWSAYFRARFDEAVNRPAPAASPPAPAR